MCWLPLLRAGTNRTEVHRGLGGLSGAAPPTLLPTHPGRPPPRDQAVSRVVQAVQVVLEGVRAHQGGTERGYRGYRNDSGSGPVPPTPDVNGSATLCGGTNGGTVSGASSDLRSISVS